MASEDDAASFGDEEFENQGGRCGIIFLIDTRLSMFTKDFTDDDNTEHTKFNIAIKCCRTILMNKIIAKQKDLIGVVLFGTDKADAKTNTKHVTLLLDLNYPNAEAVKQLDSLLNDEDSVELQRTHGWSDDFLLADALWYCSSLFSRSGRNLEEKRILLFTDDSEPHVAHPDRAHMARKRAKDLNQMKISLEILPMGTNFEYNKCYKELVEIVNGCIEPDTLDSPSRVGELLERVNRLDFTTRRHSKLKWNLGNGVFVGVSLYTLYRETSVLPKEPLSRATNEPVKRVKQTFDTATSELLLPSDIVEYVSVAGEDIVFSNEEKELLKKVMEPGLTLLGFKPASSFTEGTHCGQPVFAYPEDSLIKGSQNLMKALVDRCISKKKVALCCITPRHRAQTKYVYLIPSQETNDGKTPCGFHVISLPFYNDSREMTFDKSPQINDETVELAKRLINKLKFSYKPSSFKNPKLQQFWAHLEALALEYEAPDTLEDQTVPDQEAQTERLGTLSEDFNSACSLDGERQTAPKRHQSSNSSPLSKRMKGSDVDVVKDIKAAIPIKKVDKFTVAQLKEFLTFYGKTVSGKRKNDLVNDVYGLKYDSL